MDDFQLGATSDDDLLALEREGVALDAAIELFLERFLLAVGGRGAPLAEGRAHNE